MHKALVISFVLLLSFSLVSARSILLSPAIENNLQATSQAGATADYAGMWGQFYPGVGYSNKNPQDYAFTAELYLVSSNGIKQMTLIHRVSGEAWSTSNDQSRYGKLLYPLVVFYEGNQVARTYTNYTSQNDSLFYKLLPGTHRFKLYGQRETDPFQGGTLVIEFTDGTKISTDIVLPICEDSDKTAEYPDGKNYAVQGKIMSNFPGWEASPVMLESCQIPDGVNPISCTAEGCSGGFKGVSTCTGTECYAQEYWCSTQKVPQAEVRPCKYGCFEGVCKKPEQPKVAEQVTCIFKGTSEPQKCYSAGQYGGRDFSCTTNESSCQIKVESYTGEKITWKSSCGGYQYTTQDGSDEIITFNCGPTIQPVCTETDGGNNFGAKGKTTVTESGGGSSYWEDSCYTWKPFPYSSASTYTLVSSCSGENCFSDEGYCDEKGLLKRSQQSCASCENSVCLNPSSNPTPTTPVIPTIPLTPLPSIPEERPVPDPSYAPFPKVIGSFTLTGVHPDSDCDANGASTLCGVTYRGTYRTNKPEGAIVFVHLIDITQGSDVYNAYLKRQATRETLGGSNVLRLEKHEFLWPIRDRKIDIILVQEGTAIKESDGERYEYGKATGDNEVTAYFLKNYPSLLNNKKEAEPIIPLCTSGCIAEHTCFPLGYRRKGSYCAEIREFSTQLNAGEACENNFQCGSNVCASNKCVDQGLLDKVLAWFKGLFGGA